MRKLRLRATVLATAFAVAFSALAMPGASIKAEAAAKTYKVTYKLNGGVNNKANPKKLKKGKSAKLKNPTRNGYTFKGWYKDKKLKKKTTKVYGKSKKAYRTVYAKWAKNKTTVKKPTTPAKPSQPSKPSTPTKPSNPSTGTNVSGQGTGNTTPVVVPSEPLENPADMYCIDGKNNTHNWETEVISVGFEYVCACGFSVDDMYVKAYQSGNYDLANKIFTCGVDDPFLYDDEKMPCPGCGGWCNSDAGYTGVQIKQHGDQAKYETKCTRCGQIRPDYWVTTEKH